MFGEKEKKAVKEAEAVIEELSFDDLCELRDRVNKEYYKRMLWED